MNVIKYCFICNKKIKYGMILELKNNWKKINIILKLNLIVFDIKYSIYTHIVKIEYSTVSDLTLT